MFHFVAILSHIPTLVVSNTSMSTHTYNGFVRKSPSWCSTNVRTQPLREQRCNMLFVTNLTTIGCLYHNKRVWIGAILRGALKVLVPSILKLPPTNNFCVYVSKPNQKQLIIRHQTIRL